MAYTEWDYAENIGDVVENFSMALPVIMIIWKEESHKLIIISALPC